MAAPSHQELSHSCSVSLPLFVMCQPRTSGYSPVVLRGEGNRPGLQTLQEISPARSKGSATAPGGLALVLASGVLKGIESCLGTTRIHGPCPRGQTDYRKQEAENIAGMFVAASTQPTFTQTYVSAA